MAERVGQGGGRRWSGLRLAGWGAAALLLLLPLVTNAPWTGSDYVFMGLLLGGIGLGIELLVRKSDSLAYRLGAALALFGALLIVWVNAAVGMIGSENDPLNLLFAGVLLVALIGAILARLEPAGMARAMLAAAIAQAAAGSVGLFTDVRGAVLSTAFAALWLLAAALFRKAAHDQARAVQG